MLKKRYLAIAGLAVLAIAASGCGKKNTTEQTPVQVTPTETPQATPTVTIELVNMEETTEKNVIGEKTATASKVAIVNRTGSEIASIYIRETPSDDADEDTADEWGDDLVMVCSLLRMERMQFIIMRSHLLQEAHTIFVSPTQMKMQTNVSSENCHWHL